MNHTQLKKKSSKIASKKKYKYWRDCKLPSCRIHFGTNREWQFFHDPKCQTAWHKFLKGSKEELTIEVMILKEDVKKLKKEMLKFKPVKLTKKDLEFIESKKLNREQIEKAFAYSPPPFYAGPRSRKKK